MEFEGQEVVRGVIVVVCTLVLKGWQGNSFVGFQVSVKQCVCVVLFVVIPAFARFCMSAVKFNVCRMSDVFGRTMHVQMHKARADWLL